MRRSGPGKAYRQGIAFIEADEISRFIGSDKSKNRSHEKRKELAGPRPVGKKDRTTGKVSARMLQGTDSLTPHAYARPIKGCSVPVGAGSDHREDDTGGATIPSFRHRGLKELYEEGKSRHVIPSHQEKLRNILTALGHGNGLDSMNRAGFRPHKLRGNPKGRYAVSVSGNWRVTFRFEAGRAVGVNYVDYH